MAILGLDLSLTNTGISTITSEGLSIRGTIPTKKLRGMQRIAYIESHIMNTIKDENINFAVIEGYSFNSRGRSGISLGELGGVIRLALHKKNIEYIEVSPMRAKKFLTGKGTSDKQEVIQALKSLYKITTNDDNEADAINLAIIGATLKGLIPAKDAIQLKVIKSLKESSNN